MSIILPISRLSLVTTVILEIREIILSFIGPKENSVFAIHDTKGLTLLTRLRFNFSHLNEDKFRHGFRDTVDSMCKCVLETDF